MEKYTLLLQAISTVGFPIVVCAALMWYINDTQTRTQEIIAELTTAITELKIALKKED